MLGNPLGLKGRRILRGIGLFLLASIFLFVLLAAWYAKDLPTPGKLAKRRPVESTKIYDREGGLLYQTGEERRTVLEDKDIPQNIRQATVAVEDKDFYRHPGINFKSILRAFLIDITRGRVVQGGSTITQQYVKNALLSPKRTVSRKIKELILSLELEQLYSKEEILTLYLNQIPYGSNIYGVEEASKVYFNKSAKDLTLSEAATLAAIPRAPTYYSPYGAHLDELFRRKDYVLEQMAAVGYITKEEKDIAKNEAPTKEKLSFAPRRESIKAPHFVIYVRELLIDKYGEELVSSGGLKVTTTLDPKLQGYAEEAIEQGSKKLDRYKATNAAMVSLDPKTGQILAMVGSRDYFDVEHDGNVNVTIMSRQPGSSFKPYVYATAFKGKYNPAFVLYDLRTDFGGGYSPQNYDGNTHGPLTIRQTLANSLNIPAVRMLDLVGVQNAINTARDFGITTLTDPKRYGLALVLGGGEVKLLEHTAGFGVFANRGVKVENTPILKVEERNGKVLEEYKEKMGKKPVIDPQITYEISSILSDNGARSMIFGPSSPLNFGDRPVAAKTGTTQEFRDAWTVGYTPSLAAGVWVGNNNNTPMAKGADGVVVAAPIFRNFMLKALADKEIEYFERPVGIQEITVEKYSNKLPTQYSKELIKDIFASWQIPTERDNINRLVKVNKETGQIADSSTPPDLIEERVVTMIHSERPERPNWEGPVRAWAEEHGFYTGTLPQATSSESEAQSGVKISITSPKNGATVTGGSFEISADPQAPEGIDSVEFLIDGSSIASKNSPPFSTSVSAESLSVGEHTISSILKDKKGNTAKAQVTIKRVEQALTVTNVSVTGLTASGATINFSTSNPSTGSIQYGTSSNSYPSNSPGSTTGTSHSITIGGLTSKTTYYFRVAVTDASGNITASNEMSFATP